MGGTDLLTRLLRDVSRSFYLTLRVLPASVRSQIGVSYLLARATDTIADTTIAPVKQRLEALDQLRHFIAGRSVRAPDLTPFAQGPSHAQSGRTRRVSGDATAAERELLRRIVEAISMARQFSEADQACIRATLDTITSGQILDLQRFGALAPGEIRVLETEAELDDYLYRVAGCVGEFWTNLCRAHVFPSAVVDMGYLLANGVRYGKGLQLTNILRDFPHDLQQGRCYLPLEMLRAHGLAPDALTRNESKQAFNAVMTHYVGIADGHLEAGWAYTNHIPRSCVRVRLACAWPILIGRQTLELICRGPDSADAKPAKISRSAVRKLLLRSLWSYPWPRLWNAQWRAK